MTAGSCSVAISRSRPLQCGHSSTSIANARCISAAQVQPRAVDGAPASSGPAAGGGVDAGSTRPYVTTRSR